jgi:hypothetical protein
MESLVSLRRIGRKLWGYLIDIVRGHLDASSTGTTELIHLASYHSQDSKSAAHTYRGYRDCHP